MKNLRKISLDEAQGKLSRDEMKKVMAGSNGAACPNGKCGGTYGPCSSGCRCSSATGSTGMCDRN